MGNTNARAYPVNKATAREDSICIVLQYFLLMDAVEITYDDPGPSLNNIWFSTPSGCAYTSGVALEYVELVALVG